MLTLGLATGFVEGVTPVAYLGETNELAILLGNTGERPLILEADSTTITVTFGGLFAATDLTPATGADAWTGVWAGETLTLTPAAAVSVSANDVVKVLIGAVTPSGDSRSETLSVECDYSRPVIGPDSVSITPSLSVHAQPSADRQLTLDVQLVPGYDIVYRTNRTLLDVELPSVLSFSISNPADTPLASVAPTPGKAPELELWFAYAPSDQVIPGDLNAHWGALTTLEHAANANVSAADANWTIDAGNAANGHWLLKPNLEAILGVGEDATEVFTIQNLVTYLPAGVTLLYLQYRNIPGYDDGLITLPVEKREPTPGILSFSVDKPVIDVGESVTLNWASFAAESLVLEWRDAAGGLATHDVTGVTSWPQAGADPIQPKTDTTYTLCAYDRAGNRVGDDWQQTVTLVDAPCVTSFAADLGPTGQVVAGGSVDLSWATEYADAVAITVGGAEGTESGAPLAVEVSGTLTVTIAHDANWFKIVPSKGGVTGQPKELTVDITPTISFTATPPFVPADGNPWPVTLAWTVDDPAAEVTIAPNIGSPGSLTQATVQATAGDAYTLAARRAKADGSGYVQAVAPLVVHYPSGGIFVTPDDSQFFLMLDDTLRAFPNDDVFDNLYAPNRNPATVLANATQMVDDAYAAFNALVAASGADPAAVANAEAMATATKAQAEVLTATVYLGIAEAHGCPIGLPLGNDVYLMTGTPDGRVFLVMDGVKRWISGPPVFERFGFDSSRIRGGGGTPQPSIVASMMAMPEGPAIT
jgi:hypothetical protein